jgi:hypothetical protein
VLAGLGGGVLGDFAREALDHHVSSLLDGAGLAGRGIRRPSVASLELILLMVRHC